MNTSGKIYFDFGIYIFEVWNGTSECLIMIQRQSSNPDVEFLEIEVACLVGLMYRYDRDLIIAVVLVTLPLSLNIAELAICEIMPDTCSSYCELGTGQYMTNKA
jgi:hypothetical protein